MWGCAQQALGDGAQRDLPGYRVKVPHRIRIEALSLALFVRDCNGPAGASDARAPRGVPVQCMGQPAHRGSRKVGLSVSDDQAVLPNVMEVLGMAVTVIGLGGPFLGTRDFVHDGCCAVFERCMGLVSKLQSERIQAL